jgi:tetratricopeptide (TPR) repeat protein
MSAHFQRGQLLLEQSRPEQALAEFRQHLVAEPNDPFAHGLMALSLVEVKQYKEATEEAQTAVHLAPDLPFGHYVLARVYERRRRLREAEAAIREAIELDPYDADYFALLSGIHFQNHRWADSLQAAEEGLAIDPEHVGCTNLRAMALVKLGRKEQAGATIDAALARQPENAVTHANQGWTLLERGEPRRAMEHFREALRLDPQFEWARYGIVEAMKARNIIYRWLLGYFLWMAKLPPRTQFAVIIGGYFGYRFLSGVGARNPELSPFITPVLIAYVVFALATWLGDSLFNLLLRIDRFGRLALSREQTVASNWIGVCVFGGLGLLAFSFFTDHPLPWFGAFVLGGLTLPVAAVFRCAKGWPRRTMAAYAAAMALLGLAILIGPLFIEARIIAGRRADGELELMFVGISLFIAGAVGATWVGNLLAVMRPKY